MQGSGFCIQAMMPSIVKTANLAQIIEDDEATQLGIQAFGMINIEGGSRLVEDNEVLISLM